MVRASMPSDESIQGLLTPAVNPGLSLAERIRQGNRGAEAELAANFHPRVRIMLEVKLGDHEAASDLAQEIILAVLCGLRGGRLEDDDHLSSYVWGTARNMVKHHFKKRPRDSVEVESLHLACGDNPARNAETAQLLTLVRQAIDRLKVRDRQILLLTVMDGLKPGEVAERLGLRSDLVRQRKSRGLRKVRESVEAMSRNGLQHD